MNRILIADLPPSEGLGGVTLIFSKVYSIAWCEQPFTGFNRMIIPNPECILSIAMVIFLRGYPAIFIWEGNEGQYTESAVSMCYDVRLMGKG